MGERFSSVIEDHRKELREVARPPGSLLAELEEQLRQVKKNDEPGVQS